MAMRISGIASGLDTDSMVQELVKVSSAKKEKLEKEQTTLEWKIEAWKGLNTKVNNFFNKYLNNMKYESAYMKKKTTVANENIASIITGQNAVNGTQSLAVKQIAKSGYLTGGKLSNDKSVTADTTLAELTGKTGAVGSTLGDGDQITFHVKSGGRDKIINLTGASTVRDVISSLNKAGISANFDEGNQRIFLNAGETGVENDFAIMAGNENGLTALANLGLLSAGDFNGSGSVTNQAYQYWEDAYNADGTLNETVFQQKVKETAAKEAAALLEELTGYEDTVKKLREDRTKLTDEEEKSKNWLEQEKAQKQLADAANVLRDYYQKMVDSAATDEEKAQAQKGLDRAEDAFGTAKSSADAIGVVLPSVPSYRLADKIESESRATAQIAHKVLADPALQSQMLSGASQTAVRIEGQDAVLSLNGADFTSGSNTFEINGLTITAKNVSNYTENPDGTKVYEETTITTDNDVDGIYDMVKDFFKEYNALIKEMDTLYNADSSKGYDPLTDEEKDAMSDTEIEKWEGKIKDSLLRRDSDLNTLINTFKTTMLGSYTINGKNYSLSSFGINTLGYFISGDNEKGVFHIDGDADDTSTSSKTDLLKAAISNDPETVTKFFSSMVSDLQKKVNKIMRHTENRSVYSVYDDTRLKKEYDAYTNKIKEQEKKLQALEDRYYKQFSTMETALSKLNSQQSYLSSLFGG